MKIYKIEVTNFRLLKDFTIDLEDQLSLVIGKNNCGKTSLLNVLDKFLNSSDRNHFNYDDFNIEFKNQLMKIVNETTIEDTKYSELGIRMRLFIQYSESDDLSNISKIMMDLDPDNNVIVIEFGYLLSYESLLLLKNDYQKFSEKETLKKSGNKDYEIKGLNYYLGQNHSDYFDIFRKSLLFDIVSKSLVEKSYLDLDSEKITLRDIISFKSINAKREVTNKEIDKTLSGQTSKIYKKTEATLEQNQAIDDFKDKLSETDSDLTKIYSSLFENVVKKVQKFGGMKANDSLINIISTLQHRELLEGNTTVVYSHDAENHLPEHYNGLGYMNLISMIFEIEILLQDFKRAKNEKPADINLLFIEEPEAHTHPQMQYIFIKNIKELLKEGITREDGLNKDLQYIISTHSSHIVADSVFNDIKYLKKIQSNSVVAKNLKDLEKEYSDSGEEQNFRFLRQYLTLNRAELFFADKAIFIEGDTERIVLPAMMKKIDCEIPFNPLLSQNISIVEVGAHSHIFEKFIEFIGLKKGIIITDIDSYYKEPEMEADGVIQKKYPSTGNPVFSDVQCNASDAKAEFTSNYSLIFYHKKENTIKYFKSLGFDWKILRKNKKKEWVSNKKGYLLVAYQTEEDGYHARSFEDSFFKINRDFIIDSGNSFPSLTTKYLKQYKENGIGEFALAEKGINSKPSFAIEILLNSKKNSANDDFGNWEIPGYIKEALIWLKKD